MTRSPTKFQTPVSIDGRAYGVARIAIQFADLVAAATSQAFTWAEAIALHSVGADSVPDGARITDAWIIRRADFAGTGITAVTVDVGDTADADELAAALDVFTGAKATAAMSVGNGAYTLNTYEAGYQAAGLKITVTATGANVDQMSAGVLEFCIAYATLEGDARVR